MDGRFACRIRCVWSWYGFGNTDNLMNRGLIWRLFSRRVFVLWCIKVARSTAFNRRCRWETRGRYTAYYNKAASRGRPYFFLPLTGYRVSTLTGAREFYRPIRLLQTGNNTDTSEQKGKNETGRVRRRTRLPRTFGSRRFKCPVKRRGILCQSFIVCRFCRRCAVACFGSFR